jgi:DNA-binding transcriptional regulator YdaS (Cro superfamily)
MQKLITFLAQQPVGYRSKLARAIGRPPTYFWRQCAGIRPFTPEDAIKIEKYTQGQVRCEDILPDIDWAVIRMATA